jgi:hypothetical protein
MSDARDVIEIASTAIPAKRNLFVGRSSGLLVGLLVGWLVLGVRKDHCRC